MNLHVAGIKPSLQAKSRNLRFFYSGSYLLFHVVFLTIGRYSFHAYFNHTGYAFLLCELLLLCCRHL